MENLTTRRRIDQQTISLIEELPNELLLKILVTHEATCSIDDIINVCCLSKRFHSICTNPHKENVWDLQFKSFYGQDAYNITMDIAKSMGFMTMNIHVFLSYTAVKNKTIGYFSGSFNYPSLIQRYENEEEEDDIDDLELISLETQNEDERQSRGALFIEVRPTNNKSRYTVQLQMYNCNFCPNTIELDEWLRNINSALCLITPLKMNVWEDPDQDITYVQSFPITMEIAERVLIRLYISMLLRAPYFLFQSRDDIKIKKKE